MLQAGQFDIENGWSLDERNWAILTATENTVETAEQASSQCKGHYLFLCLQMSGGVRLSEIQEPSPDATVKSTLIIVH